MVGVADASGRRLALRDRAQASAASVSPARPCAAPGRSRPRAATKRRGSPRDRSGRSASSRPPGSGAPSSRDSCGWREQSGACTRRSSSSPAACGGSSCYWQPTPRGVVGPGCGDSRGAVRPHGSRPSARPERARRQSRQSVPASMGSVYLKSRRRSTSFRSSKLSEALYIQMRRRDENDSAIASH